MFRSVRYRRNIGTSGIGGSRIRVLGALSAALSQTRRINLTRYMGRGKTKVRRTRTREEETITAMVNKEICDQKGTK